jgi:hypothetical protein
MKKYKYHYVYRITNIKTQMYYYGDRSCNCHPYEDIGIKYFSTSSLKLFIEDQKINPQDYKYKIIKIFETCREDANALEEKLHKKFDVKNHHKFINRANQQSTFRLNNETESEKAYRIARMKKSNHESGHYKDLGDKVIETKLKNGTVQLYNILDDKDNIVFHGRLKDLKQWCIDNDGSWYAFELAAKTGKKLYPQKGPKKHRHLKGYSCQVVNKLERFK